MGDYLSYLHPLLSECNCVFVYFWFCVIFSLVFFYFATDSGTLRCIYVQFVRFLEMLSSKEEIVTAFIYSTFN